MDFQDQHRGRYFYDNDRSPGYDRRMVTLFAFVNTTVGWPNNFSYVSMVHKIVMGKHPNQSDSISAGEGRHVFFHFNQPLKLVKLETKREWCDEKLIYYDFGSDLAYLNSDCNQTNMSDTFLAFYNPKRKKIVSRIGFQPAASPFEERLKFAATRLDKAWQQYEEECAAAQGDDEVLTAIVRILRYQTIAHAWQDGNGRTIVALLNKLLIENGFYPAVLDPPAGFKFGGYLSLKEAVKEVADGIARFLSLKDKLLREEL